MNWTEILGILGGALCNISIIPQLRRLFIMKSAHELSLVFLFTLIAGMFCWLAYGIVVSSLSLIFWNIVTIILGGLMLTAKFRWGMKRVNADD